MSNEHDKPAAPTQERMNFDLGRAIMDIHGGNAIGVSTTGEIHALNARSQDEKQAAQDEVKSSVAEAGQHFATLRNQVLLLEKKLAEQADEVTWLRSRGDADKKSKKKGKGK